MKTVNLTTSLNITDPTQEQTVADKLQALAIEIRALIPASENYSVYFSLDNREVTGNDG